MREFLYHLRRNELGDYLALAGVLFLFGLICFWHDVVTMKLPV